MSEVPGRDVEELLLGSAFSNPAHKEAMRRRLFGDRRALGLDDLALVAGGAAAEPFDLDDWSERREPTGKAEIQ